ncbi:hypothetical protein, partial [Ralstonia pseudosolanacearum]|uniref:hypothetical protein n=1 Tax=Ralstonia pseudosolanacearum TaxID=1310165 RepID=UPI003CF954E9
DTKQKKNPANYSLRMSTARSATMSEHEIGGTTGFRLVSQNYATAKRTNLAGGIKFLNFDTDIERYNAWQSYLTKFARFCVALDESTKYAPYMSDYTQPWTDQRFFDYFELDNLEQQLINTVIV